MWLYFDKNGALKEVLQHGNPARAGTTDFEIFAFFEDAISNGEPLFKTATIRLYKPDFYGTAYPNMLMSDEIREFVLDTSINESSQYFKNGNFYPGYVFNFGNFPKETEMTVLLDTAGLWKAIITLITPSNYNVLGEVIFNVQPGVLSSETPTKEEILDALTNQIYRELSTKLGIYTTSVKVNEEDLDNPEIGHKENTLYYVVGDSPDVPYKVVIWNGYEHVTLGMVNLSAFASKEEFVDFKNEQEALRLDWEEAQEIEIDNFKNVVGGEVNSFKEHVNEQIEGIRTIAASGGPKGVYNTYNELLVDDPNHDYFYLVKEDGHIYYWSVANNTWSDAGSYGCPQYVGLEGRVIVLNDTSYASENERELFLEDTDVVLESDRTIVF